MADPIQPATIQQQKPVDENAIRAKLTATGKYSAEDINGLIQSVKANPKLLSQPKQPTGVQKGTDYSAANFDKPVQTQSANTPLIIEAAKSFYNGLIPEAVKGIVDLPKIVLDATGNNSEGYDHFNKIATEAIDKYGTFDIPKEDTEGGIFGGWRPFVNSLGGMLGTVGGVAAMALVGDEPGAIAEGGKLLSEGAEGIKALENAAKTAEWGKKIKNLAAFSTYMIDPIMQSGKRAGLSDTNNARMTLLLTPAVAATSMLSDLWGAGLTDRILGKQVSEGITEGLETELKELAGKDVSNETFNTVAKKASSKMIDNMKRLATSPMLEEAAKAGAAGYLMGGVQQAGEQLYDNFIAPENAKTGEGKYGTQLFSKESVIADTQNALLGGLLGGTMGSFTKTPLVDQTMYGYIENAVRKGEGEGKKAIDKVNKIVDTLVKTQKISPEEATDIKAKIGRITATAQQLNMAGGGSKLNADARYEAYDLQHNVRNDIVDKFIKPHEDAVAHLETLKMDANANPAAIGEREGAIKNGEPLYNKSKEQVEAIDEYLTNLGKTGVSDKPALQAKLLEIQDKHFPQPEPTPEPVEKSASEKMYEEMEPEALKQAYTTLHAESATLNEPEIKAIERIAAEKNIDLPKIGTDAIQERTTEEMGAHKSGTESAGGQSESSGVGQGEQGQKDTQEEKITVGEVINSPITYRGQKAKLFLDGKTLVASIDGSNKEFEIGNIDDVSDHSIKDYGIEHQQSVVRGLDDGIEVRGKKYVNKYSDPTAAINYSEDGNIVSVNLETENGAKRTFTGDVAEDIAYQITLSHIENRPNGIKQLEDFINTDKSAREAIEHTANESDAEIATTQNNEGVLRKKAARKVRQENRIKKAEKQQVADVKSAIKDLPEETKQGLRDRLKTDMKEDLVNLLRKMEADGKIKLSEGCK